MCIRDRYSKANLATTDSNDISSDDMAIVEAYFQSVLGDSSDDEDDHQTAYLNTIQTIRVEEEIGELHQSNSSQERANYNNRLHLPEKHHMTILDGGADTCVIGKGWTVLAEHPTRRAHVVGFDKDIAVKLSLIHI